MDLLEELKPHPPPARRQRNRDGLAGSECINDYRFYQEGIIK